jgi:hypothetical protein
MEIGEITYAAAGRISAVSDTAGSRCLTPDKKAAPLAGGGLWAPAAKSAGGDGVRCLAYIVTSVPLARPI